LFIGNGRERGNKVASVARQQILNKKELTAAARERVGKQVSAEMVSIWERTMLSVQAVPRCFKKDSWGNHISTLQEAVKKRDSWKRVEREQPFRQDLSVKADKSPLLEAITRECLVKTQKTGKDLAGAVVICELWRLAVAL
jgi:hypothetical protein